MQKIHQSADLSPFCNTTISPPLLAPTLGRVSQEVSPVSLQAALAESVLRKGLGSQQEAL